MGLLVEGQWRDQWYDTAASNGRFVRKDATFRNWVTKDGSAGPSGGEGFKAESGRYHLYISHACPWAHRAVIFRALKQLTKHISVSVVDWLMGENGWTFSGPDSDTQDHLFGAEYLHQIYTRADPNFTGRVTVPVLWDKQTQSIVSNESSEIIRMLNSAFDEVGAAAGDYYPEPHRAEIDSINARIYDNINNGVYKSGFATTQAAYEEAVTPLFATLDWLEARLSTQRYLVGADLTEADWRLFTTLVRFDPVYVGHFKCNLRRIADYPNLSEYVKDLYQVPGVAQTVQMTHIKHHYYASHLTINPTGIVPVGPQLNYTQAHNRGRFSAL